MSRLVQCWDMEGHFPGTVIRLNDAEAAAAIAAGQAKGITAVRYLVSIPPINQGEIAGLLDAEASRLAAYDLVEILPPEPDPVEPTAGAGSRGLERPPADRMIHRAPVTKGEVP